MEVEEDATREHLRQQASEAIRALSDFQLAFESLRLRYIDATRAHAREANEAARGFSDLLGQYENLQAELNITRMNSKKLWHNQKNLLI